MPSYEKILAETFHSLERVNTNSSCNFPTMRRKGDIAFCDRPKELHLLQDGKRGRGYCRTFQSHPDDPGEHAYPRQVYDMGDVQCREIFDGRSFALVRKGPDELHVHKKDLEKRKNCNLSRAWLNNQCWMETRDSLMDTFNMLKWILYRSLSFFWYRFNKRN